MIDTERMTEYLTVEEVAKELRVSQDVIWRLLKSKRLVGFKVGGMWRVTREDLKKFIEVQKDK